MNDECRHREVLELDVPRGRTTVPDPLVGPVGIHVADADAIDREFDGIDLAALLRRSAEAAGLADDGISGHLAPVLAPVVAVAVDVQLRRIGRAGELHDRFWVSAAGATHGERRPCGCWLLSPTAAPFVPGRLAELVGIGPGIALAGAPITVSGPDLDLLESALAAEGPDAAVEALVARGHARGDARAMVLVATQTTTKVTVGATWAGRAGVETHQLDLLSTGDTFWRVSGDTDTARTFSPLGPRDAFSEMAALLPGSEGLELPAPWTVRAGP